MGGTYSGTWTRYNVKGRVENFRQLRVSHLHKQGVLRPGVKEAVLSWMRDGVAEATITVRTDADGIRLDYGMPREDKTVERITYRVRVVWTDCHLGGRRPWFICPGVVGNRVCRRRVAVLHLERRYFVCRHCLDLRYKSQRRTGYERALWTAQTIRRNLGGSPSMIEPFPRKPKGMHWRTYFRLWDKHNKADLRAWRYFNIRMERTDRFLARLEAAHEPVRRAAGKRRSA